jgi:hypothetical protein
MVTIPTSRRAAMSTGDAFRQNAQNCEHLAEHAKDEPSRKRYRKIKKAWEDLAKTQDWLDGEHAGTSNRSE